jgi:hypothetical protein
MNALRTLCLAALAGWAPLSWADDAPARSAPLPAYSSECGACHVAFPSRLLPAAAWQRLMDNLPKHFGTDASLEAPVAREIGAWLQTHAATGRRAEDAPPQDRITRSAWFLREHDEVTAAAWKRPAIGKPSNCAACHTRANEGRFGEREIRVPR